jgi:2-polyprenyl-3-methyl-5-hydroxy-6-metoxy-1,4-benzoquinol methylase
MVDSIAAVCNIIESESGIPFLKFMRDIYLKQNKSHLSADEWKEFAMQAKKLGLIHSKEPERFDITDYSLSESGFLVGNIAKEYCNWIDNQRVMPLPRPSPKWIAEKDVLDVGCSIGRWLWEFSPIAKSVQGLELREEYIEIGRILAQRENTVAPPIRQGSIENIDQYYPPKSFDFIFCRLVINYVAIRQTLKKMIDILKPNGILWIEAETFSSGWYKMTRSSGIKAKTYGCFGVANSIICELTGRQLNFRYRGRHQSSHKAAYPSERWWRSVFACLGMMANIAGYTEGTFCIWGRKER